MRELLDAGIIQLGKRLVRALMILHKAAGTYPKGHPALGVSLQELVAVVREFSADQKEVVLFQREDHLFVTEQRIKPDAAGFEAFHHMMRLMTRLGVGGVSFAADITPADLEEWIRAVRDADAGGGRSGDLTALMTERGISRVRIFPPAQTEAAVHGDGRDHKQQAKAIYAQTLQLVSGVMDDVKLGKSLHVRRAKRIVQDMVDLLLSAEATLLGLTTIRCHDEYTYNHSVNVGILSLALGQRVGLGKRDLVDLGVAAMFHDIGKSCVPLQVLNKPGPFTAEEWAVMQRHPVHGVKELLRLKGADALSARIMLGAFEHHLNVDLSGYPRLRYPKGVSLIGRIVSIADCYDAVTSSRVYSRIPRPPDATLRFMIQRSGKMYDRTLMKLFVTCIGVFPLGTLVRLDDGRLAVVTRSNPDPERWSVPQVMLIAGADGVRCDAAVIDLADPALGRRIVEILDAEALGVDVARCFL